MFFNTYHSFVHSSLRKQQIKGQVGLLFTDTEPTEVIEWFKDFRQPEFARQGNRATRTIIIPAGPEISAHNPGFAACAGTDEAHKAALTCAKGMAMLALRVLIDDDIANSARLDFETPDK